MYKQKTKKSKLARVPLMALFFAVVTLASAVFVLGPRTDRAAAATSSTVNFQARLQDASGGIVPDGFYNVEFKLYNASTGGTALWTETRTGGNTVRVANGYLTVNLGSVTAFGGSINWDQELWLSMNIGGTGSPVWDGEMSPRLKLTAVPYAFRASQLALQTGANISTLGWAGQTASNSVLLPDGSGTICLQLSSNCGFVVGTDADFIQNQNSSAQSATNFWISGTGRAGILQAATIDASSAAALNVGTTNATSINLNQNTSIAAGKTLTVQGGMLLRPSTNMTNALTVQNASASQTVFNIDTQNGLVGVGAPSVSSKLEVNGGDVAIYDNGNNARLILGDSISDYGYLQWDSTNDYLRIESAGVNGVKINDNYVSIGNLLPDQPLKVGNGTTNLFQVNTAGDITASNFSVTQAGAITGVGVNSGSGLIQGTGGFTVSGNTSINNDSAATTNINAGSSTGAVNVGNSLAGALSLQSSSTIALNSGGGTDLAASDFDFYTNSTHLWQSVESNGATTWQLLDNQAGNAYFVFQDYNGQDVLRIDGEANTVRLGQAFGSVSGGLLFHGSNTGNEITIQSADTFDSYDLTLPTSLGSAGDCLKQQDGTGQLTFTACGNLSGTLQGAYNSSTGGGVPEIKVDSTRGGVDIQDADTPIGGNLLAVRASNASGLGGSILSVSGTGVVLGQGGSLNGTLTFNNSVNSNSVTVSSATPTAPRTITLPDEDGEVCLKSSAACGFASTAQAYVQGGNSFSAPAILGTNDNNDLRLETNGATRLTVAADGSALTLAGSTGLSMQTATFAATGLTLGNNSLNTPITLQSGNGTITIGSTAASRTINIGNVSSAQVVNIGQWNTTSTQTIQIGALGTGSRTVLYGGHGTVGAGGIQLDSPNVLVRSAGWDDTQHTFRVQNSVGNNLFTVDALNNETNVLTSILRVTNTSDSANAFLIQDASANSVLTADTDSGRIVLGDGGALNGVLAFSNSSNSNIVTLQSGVTGSNYALTLPAGLGAAGDCLVDTDGSGTLGFGTCLTAAGAFVQGGNTFGTTAVLGTNDANALELRTGGNTVLSFNGISGAATLQNSSDSSSALRVLNAADSAVLTVDTSSGNVLLGASSAVNGVLIFNNAANSNTTTLSVASPSTDQSITLPNATGTVCLTSGNCAGVGGTGDVLQGGNALGTSLTLGTNDNYNVQLETNNQTRLTIDTSGSVGIGAASSGDRLYVTSSFNNASVALDDDFDPSADSGEWIGFSGASTDTVCGAAGSVSGNALRFNGGGTRSATSEIIDASNGGIITFYLYTSNQGISGCESTDNGEDIVLEYSNNGSSWTTIAVLDENNYHTITQESLLIPAGAQTSSARFRWRQAQHSGNNWDNWTLDNVRIETVDSSNAPASLHVYNSSTSIATDLLRLSSDVGSTGDVKFRVTSDGSVYADGTFYGAGGVSAGSADLAEIYGNNDNALPGDVVVFTDSRTVKKSNKSYQTGLAGVVSTQPGFTLNANDSGVPVALSGRVPVKVTIANGVIQKGDYLTSAPNGKAQKATAAGPTIGTALEDAAEDGTIEVFVHLGYYDPVDDALFQNNVLLTLQSSDVTVANLNSSGEVTAESLRVSGDAYVGGQLTVGTAKIDANLTVGGRIISRGAAVVPRALPALGYSEQELAGLPDAPVAADGTDMAGTITFTTGLSPKGGELLGVEFSAQYEADPRIVLEPNNAESAQLKTFVTKTKDGFSLHATDPPQNNKSYSFDYIIIGSEAEY